jgi:glycosyltransferase involved in cell wall biosynthesis
MEEVAIIVTILGKGGISRSAIELESNLSQSLETKIISFNSQTEANLDPKSSQILLVQLPKRDWQKFHVMFQRYSELKNFYLDIVPRNIIAFDPSSSVISWLTFRRNRKSQIIAMCHVPTSLLSWSDLLIIKWIFPKMDSIVVPSNYLRQELMSLNSRLNPKVIPNMLPEYFTKCLINQRIANQLKKYIFVGRLEKEKNPLHFLKMAEQDQSNSYVVYGSGSLEAVCRSYVEANDIQNVEFRGYTTDENPYLNASVLIVPSLTESFGIVALEAWSQGVPIVVSDTSHGIVEMIFNTQQGEVLSLGDDIQNWLSALKRLESVKVTDEVLTEVLNRYSPYTISTLWKNELLND